MSAPEKLAAKQRFLDFLATKNLRMTSQRQAIIETVFTTEEHFTAEQLLEWSRERDKSVSRATVYRTLPLLTESGLVREMDFGKDYKFYDPNYADHPNHNHIICHDCEKIVEFESEKIARPRKRNQPRARFFHQNSAPPNHRQLRGTQKARGLQEQKRLLGALVYGCASWVLLTGFDPLAVWRIASVRRTTKS